MNTKQLMWKFLIKNGSVTKKDHYSPTDVDLTMKWRSTGSLEDWLDYVDWVETTEVSDDEYFEFNGTYCDLRRVNVLKGTLVTAKGDHLRWELELDGESVLSLIKQILEDK